MVCRRGVLLMCMLALHMALGAHTPAVRVDPSECRSLIDLFIVIDGSDSISVDDFRLLQQAIAGLIPEIDLGHNKARVGMLVYSSTVPTNSEHTFSEDPMYLMNAAMTLEHPRDGTNTALGIQHMRRIFKANGRPGIPWVCVVITDGISKWPTRTIMEAKEAAKMDISMFAVGIGHKIAVKELVGIASTENQVMAIKDFSELRYMLKSMMSIICPCPIPTAMPFARCNDGPRAIGSVRTYQCLDGYLQRGHPSITCQSDFTWTDLAVDFECVPCDAITPVVDHATCDRGAYTIGTTRTYTCAHGYRATGNPIIQCTKHAKWSKPDLQCVPCGDTPMVAHGVCGAGDYTIGSTRTFTCETGYRNIGSATIECLDDMAWAKPQWSTTHFQCVPCGDTPMIAHGICGAGGYTIGSSRTFTCETGYRETGSAAIECLDDMAWAKPQWSTTHFQCVPCGDTPMIAHGICGAGDYTIGSTRTFTCETGYRNIGSATIECLDDMVWAKPQWSTTHFQCVPCGDTPMVAHGICGAGDYTIGSTRTFTCETGYRETGSAAIECLDDMAWAKPQWSTTHFQCVPCGDTPMIAHGICGAGDYTIGSTRTFTCETGYRNIGSATIECIDDMAWAKPQWSTTHFQCVPCGDTPMIAHGICGAGDYTIGSTRTFTCETGYRNIGSATIECLDDMAWAKPQWSTTHFQCVPCGDTPMIAHGICGAGDYTIGSTRTFTCETGYRETGSAAIECLDDMAWAKPQWSTTHFQCVPCGDTPIVAHGICGAGDYTIGSTRTFTCETGYRETGSAAIECLDDMAWAKPQWSTTHFQCVPCGDTPMIAHGICGAGDHTIGSTRTFTCETGYRNIGSATIECIDDMAWAKPQWSTTHFQCVPCGDTPMIAHGICGAGDYTIGSTRTFTCETGYRNIGSATIECLDDMAWAKPQWSTTHFQCVPCGDTPMIAHGICGAGDYTIGSTRTFTCETGYRETGSATIECLDDMAWAKPQWSTTHFQCVPCGDTPIVAHGICGAGDYTIGSTRTFTCETGYRETGSAAIECLDDMAWAKPQWSTTHFQCVPCGDTPMIAHGICGAGDYTIGSTRTFTCETGYRNIGSATIECIDDMAWAKPQWSTTHFQCVPCGDTPVIAHGICGAGDYTIGSTRTFTCETGYRNIGSATIECIDDMAWAKPQWSTTHFKCVPCGDTPMIAHGICGAGDYTIGSTRTFTCETGYRNIGSATIECIDDIAWAKPQWSTTHFQCVPCGDTPMIAHGICGAGDYTIGSTRTFTCKTGYREIGSATIECLDDMAWSKPQWSTTHFQCVPCDDTPVVLHGTCDDGDYTIGSIRKYSCETGYRGIGQPVTECLDDMAWTRPQWSTPGFRCIACGNTPTIVHGICGGGAYTIGSVRTFTCETGYRDIGSAAIECLDDKSWNEPQWSKPDFQCAPCGVTPIMTHGTCGAGNYTIGSNRIFTCMTGYRAVGSATIECLNDMTQARPHWSKLDFQCVPCGDIPEVKNAECGTGDNLIGSKRTFTCTTGYHPQGHATIECLPSAQWSTPSFKCIDCGNPPIVANAYTGTGPSYIGGTREYFCETNYEMIGHGQVTCRGNAQWEKPQFSCQEVKSPPSFVSTDPSVCDGCRYLNGVGYSNHPYDCNQYVQCFIGNKGLEPVYQKCPFGLFWDQNVLTCRSSHEVDCPHDRCRDSSVHSYKHTDPNICCAYWKCEHGRTYGECCKEGSSYSAAHQQCVTDYECKNKCPFEDEFPDKACDKRPVDSEIMFEQHIGNNHWVPMPCAPGTAYSAVDCECSLSLMTVPGKTRQQVCKPELYLPFTNGFNDRSGKNVYIKPENVSIRSGAAYFNGNSRIMINRFANTGFNGDLVIKFRYNEFRNGPYFHKLQALITNGDCGSDPSIVVAKFPGYVLLGAKADESKSFALPTMDKEWKEVIYIHNERKLEGKVCGASMSSWSYGPIKATPCSLQIGYGNGLHSFVGLMDDVYIYQCRPRTGILTINYERMPENVNASPLVH